MNEEPASRVGQTYVLEMLRKGGEPEEILKRMAPIVYNAALEGDVQFFRDIPLALRGYARARRFKKPPDLDFAILIYWFAGQLWLMTDVVGRNALLAYMKSANPPLNSVTLDAYKKARRRLKLKGYRAFAKRPPVLAYIPKTKKFDYAPSWTKLEPV